MRRLLLCFICCLLVFYLAVPCFASSSYDPVYSLRFPQTFDGNSSLDTGYVLFDSDHDWTVCFSFTPFTRDSSSAFYSRAFRIFTQFNYLVYANTLTYTFGYDVGSQYSIVVTHSVVDHNLHIYYYDHSTSSYIAHLLTDLYPFGNYYDPNPVVLGQFSGTIHYCDIYDFEFSSEDARSFLDSGSFSPPVFTNEFSFLFVLLILLCFLFSILVFVR